MFKKLVKIIQFLFLVFLILNPFFSPFNNTAIEKVVENENLDTHYIPNQKLTYMSLDNPPKLDYISQSNMDVFTSSDQFDGYNLFIVNRLDASYDIILVIVDMEGNVIKEKYIDTTPTVSYVSAEFINATHILYGSPTGARLWNYYTDEDISLGFKGHHEYEYNPLQGTYFTLNRQTVIVEEEYYYFDYIQEYNKTGGLIWEISTYSFQTIDMWCPYGDTINGRADVSHSNTVFFDADDDIIYFNSRNTNTFYKIDHSTGDVIWALGGYGDFDLYDLKGNLKINLFYHAHAVEKIDDNKFMIFDNDYHNITDPLSRTSRLVEITIDENTMTANETWTWEGSGGYYSGYWGDSDPLPNGNVFGTFGTFDHLGYTGIGARMIEVNRSGERVWEINFPQTTYQYGIYRAERFRFSPFVQASDELFAGSGTNISISYLTWYNFRSKTNITGSYDLYLNDVQIDSGSVEFDGFWRPTNLTLDVGILTDGEYNLTISISDEAGHYTNKTTEIRVGPYFIKRTGPTEIEIGEENSIIGWYGFTTSTLEFNLTINSTNELTTSWDGELIEFDLNSLATGIHNFTIELFNGTNLLYNETFWVTIYENSLPIFYSFPSNQIIVWNNTLLLTWEVSDSSLYNIELYLNEELEEQIIFTDPPENYTFYFDFPQINEGNHNVTLLVMDRTLASVSKTTWINVIPPSPPIISQFPVDEVIYWGHENTNLIWEVHGESDSSWILFKNDSLYSSGDLSSNIIEVIIDDWYDIEWFPGTYNLTLYVEDTYGNSTSSTSIIKIVIGGDPYADSFLPISSLYYYYGENSVGAPDGLSTQIFTDYGSGYITLDMGRNEEIIDGEGNDFIVFSESGEYSCWVGNDLESVFTIIGIGQGNSYFDLSSVGFSSARYVRIEYVAGGIVTIDAIEALNYRSYDVDNENPEIIGPDDFSIFSNITSFTISWELYDLTPLNFTISVNKKIIEYGFWNGSDISITYKWKEIDLYKIEIVLFDLFGNSASDIVFVQIEDVSEKTRSPYLYFLFLIILAAIPAFIFIRKKWT